MSKTTTSKQEAAPWKPAQGALQDVINQGQQMYASGGFQTNPYEGQRVADFSQATQQGMQGLQAGSAATPMAMGAYGDFLSGGQGNPAFDQMRATAMADTKAALGSTLAGGGLNTGLGMQSFGRGMADAIGGLDYGAYENMQNRKMQALGMSPMIQNMGQMDLSNQLQAGGMQDTRAQNVIGADMQKYYEGQNAQADALSRYANLSAMMGGMGGTSSGSETKPWSIGDVGNVASGIGSTLAFFSDRRLKENIRKVGKTIGGNNIYSYNYIGGTARHTGPMADEVPDAIVGTINGYSVVDYGKVK